MDVSLREQKKHQKALTDIKKAAKKKQKVSTSKQYEVGKFWKKIWQQ